ncbi:MAG: S41 family peptidase [Lachnospiraceae bacterium]|nr:S41 family peptidase [Lachnospiraceae bacterium]
MKEDNKGFGRGLLTGIIGGAVAMFIVAAIVIIVVVNLIGNDNQTYKIAESTNIGPNGGVMYELSNSETYIIEKMRAVSGLVNDYFLYAYDEQAMMDGIYEGMLASLDDVYSEYLDPEEYAEITETTSGKYYGIGIYVTQNTETKEIIVTEVFPGAPSEEAGMKEGDIIIAVGPQDVTAMTTDEVVELIKSDVEGSKIQITVARGEENVDLMVERRSVDYPTIRYEMIEDEIGYMSIERFDNGAVDDFKTDILDMKSKGMKGLIIDIRGNGGGTLDSVVAMLDMLLGECDLIYTRSRNGVIDDLRISDEDKIIDVPIVVLVNGGSASASEVFAGDLQDEGVATLVGTTTFGKGVVQNIWNMGDGTAVKLTISEYYTSGDRNIHGVGIEPDIFLEFDLDSYVATGEDNQLNKAIEVIKGKIYGEE